MHKFFEKLQQSCLNQNSHLCVGLDPRMESIPGKFLGRDSPIFVYNKAIIEATAPCACAYKANLAFYEAHGLAGILALKKTIKNIPRGIPIIADAKRGDIGSTAEAYAKAIFEELGFDGVTLNPLLGSDSLAPFLKYADRGLYILCLTSNPGAADFQMPNDLYLRIAEKVLEWNKEGNCGMVVGATKPAYLKKIRKVAPDLPLLLPGIGAQGGDLAETIPLACDSNGSGFIINVSRGITEPQNKEGFPKNVAAAARFYREAINKAKEA